MKQQSWHLHTIATCSGSCSNRWASAHACHETVMRLQTSLNSPCIASLKASMWALRQGLLNDCCMQQQLTCILLYWYGYPIHSGQMNNKGWLHVCPAHTTNKTIQSSTFAGPPALNWNVACSTGAHTETHATQLGQIGKNGTSFGRQLC